MRRLACQGHPNAVHKRSTPDAHQMHTRSKLVQLLCIWCAPLVHYPKSRRGGSDNCRTAPFASQSEPPHGRVAQIVSTPKGRARLSERAAGGRPDLHVSGRFSPTRRARRDAPYLGAAWATGPHVGCYALKHALRACDEFMRVAWANQTNTPKSCDRHQDVQARCLRGTVRGITGAAVIRECYERGRGRQGHGNQGCSGTEAGVPGGQRRVWRPIRRGCFLGLAPASP